MSAIGPRVQAVELPNPVLSGLGLQHPAHDVSAIARGLSSTGTENAPMTLAAKIAAAPAAPRSSRKGPIAACDIYGAGDVTAYHVIQARRANGEYWADVQRIVDEALGIEKPIRGDNFRYHWSGKCAHWDGVDL